MLPPSDHLLRTLAPIAPGSRVLDLGCRSSRHVRPFLQLGFDAHAACPDASVTEELRTALASDFPHQDLERSIITTQPEELGYDDEFFDWVVAYRAFGADARLEDVLASFVEVRRVLRSGGWFYVAMDVPSDPPATNDERIMSVYALLERAGFELSEKGNVIEEDGAPVVRAIFRRVDEHTPL